MTILRFGEVASNSGQPMAARTLHPGQATVAGVRGSGCCAVGDGAGSDGRDRPGD